jgi:YjbE family integral membrane protein
MQAQFSQPQFWAAVLRIVWIDILLSGDNAVVIAMACRGLPPRQRRWGMMIGAGVAAVLLIGFAGVVSTLMPLPFFRLISSGLLIWIAIKLVHPAADGGGDGPAAADNLWRAVRLIVIADIIMSLDNVVAVAALANGRTVLLGLGLAISIPIVVAGSAVVLALIERFPVIVWAGGAVLGWVAGQLSVGDPVIGSRLAAATSSIIDATAGLTGAGPQLSDQTVMDLLAWTAGALGAVIVLGAGLSRRHRQTATANDVTGAERE